MATAKKISSGRQFRSVDLDGGAINVEARTVALSFSSEQPVLRRDRRGEPYYEVLDHDSVDTRCMDGAPLLYGHEQEHHIGIVDSVRFDSDKKGRAVVRFGRGAMAEEKFQDVRDGILRKTSVGYEVSGDDAVDDGQRDGIQVVRFKGWKPYEVTLTPLPADPTVGVDRGNETETHFDLSTMKRTLLLNPDPAPGGGGAPAPESREMILKLERARRNELRDIAGNFRGRVEDIDTLLTKAEDEGASPDSFARSLIPKLANKPIANGSTDTQPAIVEIRSLGDAYVKSGGFKDFALKRSSKFAVEIPGTLSEHLALTRATFTTSGLTSIQKVPGVIQVDTQPLRVADLFAQGTTNSTTIRYTKESSITNAAAAVAEGGQKPEATFVLAEADVTVKKLAVIGRVSDESLQDYDYMQSYVNGRLLWMIQQLEDTELINGAGSDSITGILNVSGIQTEASAASATLADAIHKAITKVASTPGFVQQPDSIVIHPTDWQTLVLTRDGNQQYYAGGPFVGQYGVGGVQRNGPWGLTPVVTTAISQGTALVGAFKAGAQIFRKSGLMLESTNSDASDFVYNRIAIRAEERLCLVPWRPKAFCTITGIA